MTSEIQTTEIAIPSALADRATAIAVYDDESRADAKALVEEIKAMEKMVEDHFDPMCEAANKTHKMLTQKRKETLEPLLKWKAGVNGKILDYNKAKAAQERAEQVAQQRRLAEEAAALRAQQIALEEEAAIAAAVGAVDEAAVIQKQAAEVSVQAHVAERHEAKVKPGKPEGTRSVWKWRLKDKAEVPREYLMPDKEKLDFMAQKRRGTEPVAGIEFYEDFILSGHK